MKKTLKKFKNIKRKVKRPEAYLLGCFLFVFSLTSVLGATHFFSRNVDPAEAQEITAGQGIDLPDFDQEAFKARVLEIFENQVPAYDLVNKKLAEALALEKAAGKVFIKSPEVQEKGYLKAAFEGEFETGSRIDQEKFVKDILSGVVNETYAVPLLSIQPKVSLEEVGGLTLLSRGQSSYKLAHDENRTFNVRFGLGMYDGVVIPQGAEFSFNQILGWVTYEAGWKPALAIFGGGGVKPVPGGGLCQVSTTVYRAAVNSGLPMTKRKPHSLDISYYQEYGYGIDATVYPPEEIDLKFMNDTPGPIFIHTYMDEVNEEVFVDFYGVDDGRQVETNMVKNYDIKLPNVVTYTSELPVGTQEVLQRGRVGRYIEWEWNVKKADGSIENRIIETLYPAAARSVRVGEGEGP